MVLFRNEFTQLKRTDGVLKATQKINSKIDKYLQRVKVGLNNGTIKLN